MTKRVNMSDLIQAIVEKTNTKKSDVETSVKTAFEIITSTLQEGGQVVLNGFGSFSVVHKQEKKGRNPKTQEEITIPAHNKVAFKTSQNLKEVVNS